MTGVAIQQASGLLGVKVHLICLHVRWSISQFVMQKSG
jgi:hypothetical protein